MIDDIVEMILKEARSRKDRYLHENIRSVMFDVKVRIDQVLDRVTETDFAPHREPKDSHQWRF
ncbi:MAG: hypothetical protein KAW52_04990 [candidate division Zixibacteria bacterium]|nr:hypothetical protein [candidate division Zixibacteria bacterium]